MTGVNASAANSFMSPGNAVETSKEVYSNDSLGYELKHSGLPDFKVYSELVNVNSIEELKHKLLSIIKKLGFSDFLFNVPEYRSAGVLTTLPEELYSQHLIGKSASTSLLIQHAKNSHLPIFLSTITAYINPSPFENSAFQQNKLLIAAMEKSGFSDCYAIPQASITEGKNSVFMVFGKGLTQNELQQQVINCKSLLYIISEAVSMLGTSSFPDFFFGDQALGKVPEKPLRLLSALAKDNINLKEAAARLCISLDTANKHIAVVKQALGASTQGAAIYRAIKAGLITVDS